MTTNLTSSFSYRLKRALKKNGNWLIKMRLQVGKKHFQMRIFAGKICFEENSSWIMLF